MTKAKTGSKRQSIPKNAQLLQSAFDNFLRTNSQDFFELLKDGRFRSFLNYRYPPQNQTFLHKAIRCDKAKLVKRLLENGADPNPKDRYGRTPLHYAAESMSMFYTQKLLEYKANPDVRDSDGWTPLMRAVMLENGFPAKDLFLTSNIDNVRINGKHVIEVAMDKEMWGAVEDLFGSKKIEKGLLNELAPRFILNSLKRRSPNAALCAISSEIDLNLIIDPDKNTFLHLAADGAKFNFPENSITVLGALIAAGANLDVPNANQETPLDIAIRFRNDEATIALLEAGAVFGGRDLPETLPADLRDTLRKRLDGKAEEVANSITSVTGAPSIALDEGGRLLGVAVGSRGLKSLNSRIIDGVATEILMPRIEHLNSLLFHGAERWCFVGHLPASDDPKAEKSALVPLSKAVDKGGLYGHKEIFSIKNAEHLLREVACYFFPPKAPKKEEYRGHSGVFFDELVRNVAHRVFGKLREVGAQNLLRNLEDNINDLRQNIEILQERLLFVISGSSANFGITNIGEWEFAKSLNIAAQIEYIATNVRKLHGLNEEGKLEEGDCLREEIRGYINNIIGHKKNEKESEFANNFIFQAKELDSYSRKVSKKVASLLFLNQGKIVQINKIVINEVNELAKILVNAKVKDPGLDLFPELLEKVVMSLEDPIPKCYDFEIRPDLGAKDELPSNILHSLLPEGGVDNIVTSCLEDARLANSKLCFQGSVKSTVDRRVLYPAIFRHHLNPVKFARDLLSLDPNKVSIDLFDKVSEGGLNNIVRGCDEVLVDPLNNHLVERLRMVCNKVVSCIDEVIKSRDGGEKGLVVANLKNWSSAPSGATPRSSVAASGARDRPLMSVKLSSKGVSDRDMRAYGL